MSENDTTTTAQAQEPAQTQTQPQAQEPAQVQAQAQTQAQEPAQTQPQTQKEAQPQAEAEESASVGSLLGDALAKAEKEAQTAEKGAEEGVPEEYSDVQIKENFSIHAGALDGLKTAAKTAGLTQKQFDTICKGYGEAHTAISQDLMRQARTQWEAQIKADPEIGGANLDKTLVYASKALNKFASKELKEYLNTSGLGSSPEIVRLFYRIGKAVSQDTPVVGGASTPTPRRRYPNSEMVADIY